MGNVGPLALPGFTWGAAGVWTLVATVLGIAIKTWPVWRQKINEARKIELDADRDLRGDLFKRISELETQLHTERIDGDARHARCEEVVRELRSKLDGLVRQFLAFQMATARAIPLTRTPEMSQALDALKGYLDDPGEKEGK